MRAAAPWHLGRPDQIAREVGPVERVREEEPQRRDDAVQGNAKGLQLPKKPIVIGARQWRSSPKSLRVNQLFMSVSCRVEKRFFLSTAQKRVGVGNIGQA